MTPVTDTYIQIGHVHRAMRRWRATSSLRPRRSVISAIGTIAAARDDVRDQDGEVEQPDGALARERPRPDVGVVDDVRDEEERRRDERRHHAGAMRGDALAPDEDVTRGEQTTGDAVERGIQRRQIADGHQTWLASISTQSTGR